MMKRRVWGILMGLTVLLLSGCTTEYGKSDIEAYVKENLELKKFTVSDNYETVEDEEGYRDRRWTVVDQENDITFHVLDDYHWGMEATTNSLWNDYSATVFLTYEDRLPKSSLVSDGRIVIRGGANEEGINEASLECLYRDRTELGAILNEISDYDRFFKELGIRQVYPSILLSYEGPEDHPCKGHMVAAETWGRLDSDRKYLEKEALRKYFITGLDYRLEEVFADASEEELQEVILAERTDRVGIVEADGSVRYYEDLIGNDYSYGLSVSTLYLVLEREGLEPVGDMRHFTCTGADGREYEFSCDFVKEAFDEGEGAYYLADGVPVQLGYAYNIHIHAKKASDLFGIQIVTDWNRTITENAAKEEQTENEQKETETEASSTENGKYIWENGAQGLNRNVSRAKVPSTIIPVEGTFAYGEGSL